MYQKTLFNVIVIFLGLILATSNWAATAFYQDFARADRTK